MFFQVKNLKIRAKDGKEYYPVIEDINFSIEKGKTLGLVGESGSGKSVTALAILGLLNRDFIIDQGEIILDGVDLLKLDSKKRRSMLGNDIGIIFQNPMNMLNPLYTIYDQIAENLRNHNKDLKEPEIRKRVIEALEEVYIPEPELSMNKYPHEFSGGQRQRILIAMAIINKPKLLIADEATTALDVTVQYKILILLKSLCRKYGTTLIVISHNFGVIKFMSDQAVVMYTGKIMEKGPIRKIIEQPQHPYTKSLMISLPENAKKGEKIPVVRGSIPMLSEKKENCPFYPRCNIRTEDCLKTKIEARKVSEDHYVYCLEVGDKID